MLRSVSRLPVLLVLALWLGANPRALAEDVAPGVYADFETTRGAFTAELFFEKAPLTVMTFVGLAEGTLPTTEGAPLGKPFYDGLTFHRVVPGFVIQGGDPLGTGEGGPGFDVPDEFTPGVRHDRAGILSMANGGADTNGSQFFVTLAPEERLNYLHPVFGRIVSGGDVPEKIVQGDRIIGVKIRRVGPAAEGFRATPERFAELKVAVVKARRPAAPAGFVYFKDATGKLPAFRVDIFNLKLANYERITGRRIVARVFDGPIKNSPARAAVRILATELGLPDAGDDVLACLFVEPSLWRLRLGEKTFAALLGDLGAAGDSMARGRQLHASKNALTAPAEALAAEGKLKESCDAMIDAILLGLDGAKR